MAGISKKRIKTKKGEVIRYTITYVDLFGKRHTSGYYETLKEAKKDLKKFETPKADNSIKYGYIFQTYLKRCENKLAQNTLDKYKHYYDTFFNQFDEIRYDKINSVMWQNIFDDLFKNRNPFFVEGCLTFAKASVNFQIKHGQIEINVFNKVEKIKTPKPNIEHLTISELKEVLDECKRSYKEYYPLLYTFIGTGAREGEIFALEKSDINVEENYITISKQFTKGKLLYHPKTEHSNRKIYIFKDLKEVLIEHIKTLKPDNPLLFPNSAGNYINASNFRNRVFNKLLELCGINKRIRIHDLRGSYTDTTIASGLSVKFTQNQLGHAKAETTMNIYMRNNADMINNAMHRLNNIFAEEKINQQKISNKIILFPKSFSRQGDLNP
jgi:integrase